MAKRIAALESLARDMVGDSGSPNLFFVTDRGAVVTITRSFHLGYKHWRALLIANRGECALEDRRTGTIASREPESDAAGARLVTIDDSASFRYRR